MSIFTFVVLPFLDILEIKDTGVVIVLPREDDQVNIARMSIGDGVT